MKIQEIVYLVTENEIIKTKIIGKREVLVSDYDKKETIETKYLVRTASRNHNDSSEDWVGSEDLLKTQEEARAIIEKRVTAEIVERLSKITMSDVTGGTNGKK